MPSSARILGVDPGLNKTGWGIIEQSGSRLSFVGCGVIAPKSSLPLAERLLGLHRGMEEVIAAHHPDSAAIEESFSNVNAVSTLKLGNARGALLLSLSLNSLPVYEYAATQVKKAIVGVGRAEKEQVAAMVRVLLPGCAKHAADAMDALAVAICHAHSAAHMNLLEAAAR